MKGKGPDDSPNTNLSFDNEGEYDITITNPLSIQEEERLEWYFEKYLVFPFVEGVKFRDAQESITKYGHALFDQLFRDKKAYVRYSQALKEGPEKLRFEIIGSPEFFHQLHWEALKDPDWPTPFVLDAPMVRTTFHPPAFEAESQVSPTINLLIVTARPFKSDYGYRTVSKPLVESLGKAKIPVKIDILRPGTYEALSRHLDAVKHDHGIGYYHIIHFDLHGALTTYEGLKEEVKKGNVLIQTRYGRKDYSPYEGHKAFLSFESSKPGQSDPVEAKEIADFLKMHSIPIAVLNACQSAKLTADTEASLGSRLLEAGVQTVVAMGYSVTVTAAARMMTELYRQLFESQNLSRAICSARKALHDDKNRKAYYDRMVELEDWMLPVVYQNGGALAEPKLSLRDFTAPEEKEYWRKRSRLYHAPDTTYGFVGRDLDVLEIERRLLAVREGKRSNMLLIQGMGGSGKTTLLKHLMEWWQTTGFVERVFYFGYDERAWNAGQIMDRLVQELLPDKLGIFRALEPAAQREMLGQKMCSERHLLVLDNMESITGASLAIKNTLKPEEQQELRSFLAGLLGGESMVLMGSRGPEEWLAKGEGAPLRQGDVYQLPGLDKQAASTLAERVMERNVADPGKRDIYRRSDDFQKLMKLLDGYPLPIQVVLANLSGQTPEQILEALKKGGAVQDSEIQKKTESIMLCIEYSHGHLDVDEQKLLLTLAPFTGVVFQPLMEKYIEYLKQQPALKDLPYQRMPEVLQQARNWGLVTDDLMPGYLRLQPVLPYFLRTRLNQEPGMKEAVEAAYRAHYDYFAVQATRMMASKEAHEKQTGQMLVGQEYENIYTALEMDLKAKESILQSYGVLSRYLRSTQEDRRGLDIGEMVRRELEDYPIEALQGPVGAEMAVVIDDIAAWQLSLRQYMEAEESYKRALCLLFGLTNQALDAKTRALLMAGVYHQLGRVAQEQRQWTQTEEYFQKALKIFVEFNDWVALAKIYHNIGIVAQEQRHWKQAENYCQKALEIYIEFKDRFSQASAYHQLGMIAQEQRQWTQADAYYKKALQICIEFEDRYSQARPYHQLGMLAQEQRQWTQADAYYRKALEIYIEFNDRLGQAGTYHQLGRVAQEQRQWAQAERYYQKALQIYIEFKDRYSQGSTYHNLGIITHVQKQWTQAERYYQKALEISIEFNDRYHQASTYHQLGIVAQEQKQWHQAEDYYKKALDISIESNDRYEQASTYHQLGKLAQDQTKWDIARENILKALEIFIEFRDEHGAANALGNLARLWQVTKDSEVLNEVVRILNIDQDMARKLLDKDVKVQ
ncbi:MAG: tetratricopeptide repeat protein [Methanothrix sp.]|nr:tetratricopeptide repeat protein [Methanothrix sp.]